MFPNRKLIMVIQYNQVHLRASCNCFLFLCAKNITTRKNNKAQNRKTYRRISIKQFKSVTFLFHSIINITSKTQYSKSGGNIRSCWGVSHNDDNDKV